MSGENMEYFIDLHHLNQTNLNLVNQIEELKRHHERAMSHMIGQANAEWAKWEERLREQGLGLNGELDKMEVKLNRQRDQSIQDINKVKNDKERDIQNIKTRNLFDLAALKKKQQADLKIKEEKIERLVEELNAEKKSSSEYMGKLNDSLELGESLAAEVCIMKSRLHEEVREHESTKMELNMIRIELIAMSEEYSTLTSRLDEMTSASGLMGIEKSQLESEKARLEGVINEYEAGTSPPPMDGSVALQRQLGQLRDALNEEIIRHEATSTRATDDYERLRIQSQQQVIDIQEHNLKEFERLEARHESVKQEYYLLLGNIKKEHVQLVEELEAKHEMDKKELVEGFNVEYQQMRAESDMYRKEDEAETTYREGYNTLVFELKREMEIKARLEERCSMLQSQIETVNRGSVNTSTESDLESELVTARETIDVLQKECEDLRTFLKGGVLTRATRKKLKL